eukprot:TRINITY_DN11100_c0_g1_i3.p2 TRINITY_DN11100_c0_g1~~TRINITY_DN11100_c0_g1_i3.p2  ORF type:complete len:244 (+),score=86.17 TRINITY_DN11100_c0_g1_i3:680-1411(+)
MAALTGRRVAQLEKDLAAANGIVQATKEALDDEKTRGLRELNAEREKAQASRLKSEATIDQLQRELAKKHPGGPQQVVGHLGAEEPEENSSGGMLKVVLNEIRGKKKESDNMQARIEYQQRARALESDYQDKLAALKTQMKHVFNLDLQNLKLTYEHQIKQLKITIKRKDEESKLLKEELIKKESEIGLTREKNRYHENERKLRLEHAEFLCRVRVCVTVAVQLDDGVCQADCYQRPGNRKSC